MPDKHTYHVGLFGVYAVALVQSDMGAGGAGGSHQVVGDAIHFWHPKATIMIGIAFGLQPNKQHLGDVLVAQLAAYDLQRITGDSADVTHRGTIAPPGVHLALAPRFAEADTYDWRFGDAARKSQAKVLRGLMLSGQVLVDSRPFAESLLKSYPEALGGEMEGVGVSSACLSNGTQWIVVKGICDFAGLAGRR